LDYGPDASYVDRQKGGGRDLVYRARDDSVEDIRRDFPPAGRRAERYYEDDDYRPRARSVGPSRRDYNDERAYYNDRDLGTVAGAGAGAGAAAGYSAGRARDRRQGQRDNDRDYDSDPDSKPRNDRRKSGVVDMLQGLGLGGVAGALLGKKNDRDRSRDRDRDYDDRRNDYQRDSSRRRRYSDESDSDKSNKSGRSTRSRRDPRNKKGKTERQWAQAAQAALLAGITEAVHSRGLSNVEKGRRILTAAIGAGGVDGIIDRDPDKKSKRHLFEAVVGGLAANRAVNGSTSRSRGRDRSPSRGARSRATSIFGGNNRDGKGGGLKDLAAGGALAAAGKAIYDRVRSRSQRRRSRSPSSSSNDSYEAPSRNRRNGGAKNDGPSSRNSDTNADRALDAGDPRSQQDNGQNGFPAVAGGATAGAALAALTGRGSNGQGQQNGQQNGQNGTMTQDRANAKNPLLDDSSSSEDVEDVETKRKKMRGKELLTAGLATIATIHAAHGVYASMEAHEKRHKLVAEGEMTPQEARKRQTKAWVQDAAAVGIASLGIKGAFSEWKEMNEHR